MDLNLAAERLILNIAESEKKKKKKREWRRRE